MTKIMSKTVSKFALAAGIALAVAFTLSCFPGGGDEGGGSGGGNTFADSRDGKTYKNVTIGEQVWFAENLNYNASGSKCYGEDGEVVDICDEDLKNCTSITLSPSEVQANCAKYGRLYDWQTALTVCPPGWHLPTQAELDALSSYVESNSGCSECDARLLKTTSGWNRNGNGTDKYGFSALPGGSGSDDGFSGVGKFGYLWSASESGSSGAYLWGIEYDDQYVHGYSNYKSSLLSVRCLKD